MAEQTSGNPLAPGMTAQRASEIAHKAMANRRFGLQALATTMRFLADVQTLKNHYSKADRYCRAWEACQNALRYDDVIRDAVSMYSLLDKHIDAEMIALIDAEHNKRFQQLCRTKSHERQWAISTKAADLMAKFRNLGQGSTMSSRAWVQHAIDRWQYWAAQVTLVNRGAGK